MPAVTAEWTIELNCDCQGCGLRVDLLDYADFWDARRLGVGEHNTERSTGMDVVCPECYHEFTVDCQY